MVRSGWTDNPSESVTAIPILRAPRSIAAMGMRGTRHATSGGINIRPGKGVSKVTPKILATVWQIA